MQKTSPQSTTQRSPVTHDKVPLSRHPFVIPVLTFLGLFLITAVLFVSMGAQTIGPTDKRVVQLYVDGEQRTVPTRARTVSDLLDRLGISIQETDIVEPSLDAPIDSDNFTVNIYKSRSVTVVDTETGSRITAISAQPEARDVAKEVGLTIYPEDKVRVTPPEDVFNEGVNERVIVDRATLTYINLYGTKITARTHATTVEALLKERNITIQPGDQISPAPDAPVTKDTQVFVVRTGKKIETKTEVIPAPLEVVNDPTVAIGTTTVKSPGKPGKRLVTYELELENGKVVARKELQNVIAVKPEKRVEVKGTKVPTVAISGNKAEILAAAGVPASQHFAADFIISKESGWRLNAQNAGGCLGLGQACPGSKLVAACPAWQTDVICQVQFFTGYVNGRYGGWSGAYQTWQIQGWY